MTRQSGLVETPSSSWMTLVHPPAGQWVNRNREWCLLKPDLVDGVKQRAVNLNFAVVSFN